MVKQGFSSGLFFCVSPFVAIVLFYLLDLIYRRGFTPMVNRAYWLCTAYLLGMLISLPIGYHNGSPFLNPSSLPALALLVIAPFNAAVIVQVYNRDNPDFDMAKLLLKGLIILIVINLLGYAAGMHNLLHTFAGRISVPFTMGIYDSAHILAFVNLMLLFYLRDFRNRPVRFTLLASLYAVNLVIILSVNSRLSIMIFFLFTILFLLKVMRTARGIYAISLFTMPLMMSFALLIYKILSLPFFSAVLGRVDKEDVTTFNGRTYIWQAAADWAMKDRRGMLFGNGYNGQQHIHLLDRVAKMWNEKHPYNLHMHSTFLEVLVDQGVLGYLLLCAVFWAGFSWYRREYLDNSAMAPLYAGFVYLLFIWQIDIFCYGIYIGPPLLFTVMAPLCIDPRYIVRRRKALNGSWLD